MNWRDHITADPEILTGKPIVMGTELSVDFILGLLAQGWSEERLYEEYPQITPQALQAVFSFILEILTDEEVLMLRKVASDPVLL